MRGAARAHHETMISALETSLAASGLSGLPGVFGRLHPVLVHLPIGLLVALGVLELASLRGAPSSRRAQSLLATLAAVAALVTAGAGWVLHLEEPGSEAVERHEQLGIALAFVTAIAATAHARSRGGTRLGPLKLYRAALALALVLLVPTGHIGATLTHGEGYLTAPLERASPGEKAPASDGEGGPAFDGPVAGAAAPARAEEGAGPPAASSFERLVQPVLAERCGGCHGETRKKGGLALHTRAAIEEGGENGPVLVAGAPEASELLRRVLLPLDDDDHMPPSNKPQPSERELARLEAWVAAGAPFEGRVEALEALAAADGPDVSPVQPRGPGEQDSSGESARASGGAPGAVAIAAARARDAAIERLRAELVHVEPLAQDSPLLWIDFAAASSRADDELVRALLEPVVAQVAQLSLARTRIGDATLALCARMTALERLDLRATAVTRAGLEALRGHPRLAELVLAQTGLDDAAADLLVELPALRRVHLWRAGLSEEARARLATARPEVTVESGTIPATQPELEPPIVLVRAGSLKPDASSPADSRNSAESSSRSAVNTICPVSGAPAKPEYVILFEGRAIGFCCPNCPAKFWAEPGTYRGKLP